MNEVKTAHDTKAYIRRRRIVGLASLAVILALSAVITYFVKYYFFDNIHSGDEFRAHIQLFGWKGRFVFLGLQILQVVVAMIPGEFVQVGAGYAFGPVEGTLLCMVGAAIASTLIFLLTKKFGVKLVEAFISRKKIDDLRFINSEEKLKRLIFVLFFIPGSPKDLFTYFVGLTRIKLHEFLAITLIARTPALVSSTIGGYMFGTGNYMAAVSLFAVTGLISLGGMWLYSQIEKSRKRNRPDDKADNKTE